MDLSAVITQLRTYATVFGGRVAGAADYAALKSDAKLTLPCCFVVPGETTAEPNALGSGQFQWLTETIGAIVIMDNATLINDRRGQTAATQVDTIRDSIWSALLWWQFDPRSAQGLSYAGDQEVEGMTQARLPWAYSFSQRIQIVSADGFQPVYPDLDEVDITVSATKDGIDPAVVEVIVIPD